ncbi:hypothetical protein NDU88_006360, partial [Pleurodeles waltl]
VICHGQTVRCDTHLCLDMTHVRCFMYRRHSHCNVWDTLTNVLTIFDDIFGVIADGYFEMMDGIP